MFHFFVMAKNAFWTPKKALKWVRRVGLTIFCRKGTIYAFLAQSSAAEIAPFPMPPRPILAAKKALFPPFLTPKLSDGRRSRAQKSNGWSGSRTTRSKRATPAFHSGQGLLNTDSPNRSIRSKQKPLPEFPWAARAAGLWWWWWAWASLQDDVGSDGGGGSVTYVCSIRFACRRRGRKKEESRQARGVEGVGHQSHSLDVSISSPPRNPMHYPPHSKSQASSIDPFPEAGGAGFD